MAKAKSYNGSDGKLLDTWHYEYSGLAGAGTDLNEDEEASSTPQVVVKKKVEIELRLLKNYTGDTPPLAVKEVAFLLVCRELDIRIKGTDLEVLRTALWTRLDKHFEIKWERFFLVRVTHETGYHGGIATGLVCGYKSVYRGTAWDGTLLLREYEGRSYTETLKPWPGRFADQQGKVLACIPATEANEAALQEFQSRIDKTRELLADYLRPSRIEDTRLRLSTHQGLLPPGEEQ